MPNVLHFRSRGSPPDQNTGEKPFDLTNLPQAIAEDERRVAADAEVIERCRAQGFSIEHLQRAVLDRQRLIWHERLLLSELKKNYGGRTAR
jgi:hypothetical protein